MALSLIILTVFTFVVLVTVIGFSCLVRRSKVSPSGAAVHGVDEVQVQEVAAEVKVAVAVDETSQDWGGNKKSYSSSIP
ncbi:hypothetical protein PTKIN_Ptkin06aG0017300 [Pterospermum kingtungense]